MDERYGAMESCDISYSRKPPLLELVDNEDILLIYSSKCLWGLTQCISGHGRAMCSVISHLCNPFTDMLPVTPSEVTLVRYR